MQPLRVFIGFDKSESIAAYTLAHSVFKHASGPVSVSFLRLEQLRSVHKRERHPLQSTDFSFTRFLVPSLCGYQGIGIFMDCDMLCLDDVYKLKDYAGFNAVACVKHDHKPTNKTKMLGQVQTSYPRKNWSSLMVFSNEHYACKNLTPEVVDSATGLHLHQMEWARDSIGGIPHSWNHLVGYQENLPIEELSLIHWTEGGPWWSEYKDAPYSDTWREYRDDMLASYERVKHAAA